MAAKTADIKVTGGILVSGKGMERADVLIKDGLVDSIEAADSTRSATKVIDAGGKLVLPGIIDAHQHPVYTDRMGTLSQSAAYGGITTIIPYIGAVPAWGVEGDLSEAVEGFIEEGNRDSFIDFGYHCCLMHDDMATIDTTIPKTIDRGVTTFKGFMAYKKRGMLLEDEELIKVMEVIAEHDGLFAVHAENGPLCDFLEDRYAAQGDVGPKFFLKSRPNITEAEAVFRILSLAKTMKCPTYLVHLSARESLEVVEMFRKWGAPELFTETCSHYLTLTDETTRAMGSMAKVSPPLRSQEDLEALWQAVDDGRIDVVASDTAGHVKEKKEPIHGDVFKAPAGLPGEETAFIVTYDEGINKGRTNLNRLVEVMCEKPAKIFGLAPKKGVLAPGADADLVIFDPTKPYTIKAADQHAKVDYSMYEGRECIGAPVLVMQRGQVLVEDGELKAQAGQGQYLPRKRFSQR